MKKQDQRWAWVPIVFVPLLLCGCPGYYDCDFVIKLPAKPLNMVALNSAYDDWNSCAPWAYWEPGSGFLFSSNRASQGGQFDLTPMPLTLQGDNDVEVMAEGNSNGIVSVAAKVNTAADELGASFWFLPNNENSGALVFSRGDSIDHDLFTYIAPEPWHLWDWNMKDGTTFSADAKLIPLEPLNTTADEGYATWSASFGAILFHSNRSGRYRIYQARVPTDLSGPFIWLQNPDPAGVVVSQVDALASSDGEERCPFLIGNTLYFVSNRSGGQGGFDIYRSVWSDGAWSAPENLGATINSSANEYRPFAISVNTTGDGLIFSSDRQGGAGGYDLYLVATSPL